MKIYRLRRPIEAIRFVWEAIRTDRPIVFYDDAVVESWQRNGELQNEISLLRHTCYLLEHGSIAAELKRVRQQNVELYRAFRHKMDRKAKWAYRMKFAVECAELGAEVLRLQVINRNLKVRLGE